MNKVSAIFENIYATLMTLGFIAADIAMIYWACWNSDFVSTMMTIAWILITLAVNAKVWFNSIKKMGEL